MNRLRYAPVLALLFAVASACGSADSTASGTLTLSFGIPSNDQQTGTVGKALPLFIQAKVVEGGSPKQGVTVNWATPALGGSLPASSVTDQNGLAKALWTLGHNAATQQATASVAGASGSPLTFTAFATADVAASLGSPGGNDQVALVGAALAQPLTVRITDQFGNPVQGTDVVWAVTGGDATVGNVVTKSNASGVASVTLTVGSTPGPITVTATSGALAGSPATLTAVGALGVHVGDNFFQSVHNNTKPAVDTIPVGGAIAWSWIGTLGHSVQSLGSPSFSSSTVKQGAGQTYVVTFGSAGTYQYDCGVHGVAMSGSLVVQ